MIRRIKQLLIAAVMATGLSLSFSPAMNASAFNPFEDCPADSQSQICKAAGNSDAVKLAQNIISAMLWLIGIISVIMIVFGGFKFVTSNGDSNSIQSAKNTVLYSVIGLIVAILGQAIVFFVVNWFA